MRLTAIPVGAYFFGLLYNCLYERVRQVQNNNNIYLQQLQETRKGKRTSKLAGSLQRKHTLQLYKMNNI